ncbi:MAG: hypothetical protein MK081_15960 [Flavobacteriales bacterium]|nr:hypothetical protein [Flavobacteriales bacterium]
MTGPKKLTFAEATEIIAEGIGRDITYVPITMEEFKDGMKAAGLPESYIWLFEYLFQEVLSNPDNQEISNDMEKVLGRKATSFEEFTERTLTTGIWNQEVTF